jgi:hypothetical protein
MWNIGEAAIGGLGPDPQMEEDNAPVVVPACGNMAVPICSPPTERAQRTASQWGSVQYPPAAFHDMHTAKIVYCSCCTRDELRRTGVQDRISLL